MLRKSGAVLVQEGEGSWEAVVSVLYLIKQASQEVIRSLPQSQQCLATWAVSLSYFFININLFNCSFNCICCV
jgi:hypothetical protein